MLSYCFPKASLSTESINMRIRRRLKYHTTRLGYIQGGSAIFIWGKIKPTGDRFYFDFSVNNKDNDKALRLAVRLSTNSLGCNSRIARIWGEEETYTDLPFQFKNDRDFEFEIYFTTDKIYFAYNGLHITTYEQRIPCQDIGNIKVRGDVTQIRCERRNISRYPTAHNKTPHILRWYTGAPAEIDDLLSIPDSEVSTDEREKERPFPLPYYVTFSQLFSGRLYRLFVRGRIRQNSEFFQLALQIGQHIIPQPPIALLLEFHFTKQDDGESLKTTVVRNSYVKKRWSDQMKVDMDTGLKRGNYFHLIIEAGPKGFEIFINSKFVTDYPYKMDARHVNTCFLTGDIKLVSVGIEKDPKFTGGRCMVCDKMLAVRKTKSF